MNEYITDRLSDPNGDPTSYHYETLADIIAHPPADAGAVMIDTHSDSIASGIFLLEAPFRGRKKGREGKRGSNHIIYHLTPAGDVICFYMPRSPRLAPAWGRRASLGRSRQLGDVV